VVFREKVTTSGAGGNLFLTRTCRPTTVGVHLKKPRGADGLEPDAEGARRDIGGTINFESEPQRRDWRQPFPPG
jgi:hypothetical protein